MGRLNQQEMRQLKSIIDNQQGAIGYIFAWFMGVPAVVLVAIWLLRGHN